MPNNALPPGAGAGRGLVVGGGPVGGDGSVGIGAGVVLVPGGEDAAIVIELDLGLAEGWDVVRVVRVVVVMVIDRAVVAVVTVIVVEPFVVVVVVVDGVADCCCDVPVFAASGAAEAALTHSAMAAATATKKRTSEVANAVPARIRCITNSRQNQISLGIGDKRIHPAGPRLPKKNAGRFPDHRRVSAPQHNHADAGQRDVAMCSSRG